MHVLALARRPIQVDQFLMIQRLRAALSRYYASLILMDGVSSSVRTAFCFFELYEVQYSTRVIKCQVPPQA